MQEYHCLYRTKTNKKGGYLSNSHVHEYRACSGVTLFSDLLGGAMISQRGGVRFGGRAIRISVRFENHFPNDVGILQFQ